MPENLLRKLGRAVEGLLSKPADANLLSLTALSSLHLPYGDPDSMGEVKRNVAASLAKFKPDLTPIENLLKEVAAALKSNGYRVKVCEVTTEWRSIAGTSESGFHIPFEVGLFWDPVYNVPYIPGTSIKGAIRWAFKELLARRLQASQSAEEEAREKVEAESERIFGSGGEEGHAGLVGFTDAFPIKTSENLLEPDVVTPHYQGKPNEWEIQPVPNVFVTVAKGVTFRFYIFYVPPQGIPGRRKVRGKSLRVINKLNNKSGDADIFSGNLAEQPESLLDPGLVPLVDLAVLYAFGMGVGAKTSAGYSRFAVARYEEWSG
ncbi:MAG: type III-B CRISPR module RAMP protein Cmr6 [Thermofilum sp.]|jgi:CRISPR-associated protein Cmr6|nr:type III-B CRISPR module RAMP protein Cmr6 [Thermofilum sp.]